jgi:hypothetical protein
VGMPRSCLLGGAKGEFEAGLGNCSNEHPYSGEQTSSVNLLTRNPDVR